MRTVHTFKDGDCEVKLEVRTNGTFRVTYGLEVHDNLNEVEAGREYGECVMHSLHCAGLTDECDIE